MFKCIGCLRNSQATAVTGNLLGLVLSPLLLGAFGWRVLFCIFGIIGGPLLAIWQARCTCGMEYRAFEYHSDLLKTPTSEGAQCPARQPAQGELSRGCLLRYDSAQAAVPDAAPKRWEQPAAKDLAKQQSATDIQRVVETQPSTGTDMACSTMLLHIVTLPGRQLHPRLLRVHVRKPNVPVTGDAAAAPSPSTSVGVGQMLSSSAAWAIIVVNIVNHWGKPSSCQPKDGPAWSF